MEARSRVRQGFSLCRYLCQGCFQLACLFLSALSPTRTTSISRFGELPSLGISLSSKNSPMSLNFLCVCLGCFDGSQWFHCSHSSCFCHTGNDCQVLRRSEKHRCDIKPTSNPGQTHSLDGVGFEPDLLHKQGEQSFNNLIKFLCVRSRGFRRDNATVKKITHCSKQ